MFELEVVSQPSETPVSVSDAKLFLRVDNNLEDGRIETLIKAATLKVEEYTSLKLVTQDVAYYLDRFPISRMGGGDDWWDGTREGAISELVPVQAQNIVLPVGKVQSLVSFSTFGDDNVEVVSNPSDFIVDNVGYRGRVGLKTGGIWPTTVLRANNGIKIVVRVGFGNASAVPDDLKQAILELVAHLYENRGDQKMEWPGVIMALINRYRRVKIGY